MEAAAHTKLYISDLLPDYVILKLYFKNGFNSTSRDKVLEACGVCGVYGVCGVCGVCVD